MDNYGTLNLGGRYLGNNTGTTSIINRPGATLTTAGAYITVPVTLDGVLTNTGTERTYIREAALFDTSGPVVDGGFTIQGPVSYTHLDVYKRQPGCHPPTTVGQPCRATRSHTSAPSARQTAPGRSSRAPLCTP